MKFKELCETYEKVEKISSKIEMINVLSETLKKAKPEEIGKIALMTLGKIYPDFYGIELMLAEAMTIKALALSTGKSIKSVEHALDKIGDLGLTAFKLLDKKAQSTLLAFTNQSQEYLPEVLEVWQLFDKIARTTGEGSSNKKIHLLSGILSRISALEAKFLIRMVSSQLRLGVATQLLLESLSLAKTGTRENKKILERAYNRCSDISYVAEVLYKGGISEVKKIDVRIFTPVRAMLAQRLSSAEEILKKFSGRCSLEYKYDGLRAQIHFKDGKTKIFSRRSEDITHQFPDIIKAIKDAALVNEFIIEGEIVAYDEENDKILPFQQVSQRKRKHDIENKVKEVPVKAFVFDVLYAESQPTLDKPYLQRRKLLSKVVKETSFVQYSHQTVVTSIEEIESFFQRALKSNCEGIMGKSIDENSVYQAGARGWNWIKYKADYVDALTDTFDLVIVGAEYGKGKRTGKYGTFLLACFDPEEGNFKTFTRVATGFSDEDLDLFYSKLEPLKKEQKPKVVQSDIESAVWFEPEIVIEVSGAEITISQMHTCARGYLKNTQDGLALRFPRFTGRIVEDKTPEDCTTVGEIVTIFLSQEKET
ncbi:MAG: ATP-dependent DNA ligase [Candidatus Heimdallarchaeaceae archaeon]